MRNRILQKRQSVQICCSPFTHFSVVECEAGPEIEVGAAIFVLPLLASESYRAHGVFEEKESTRERERMKSESRR